MASTQDQFMAVVFMLVGGLVFVLGLVKWRRCRIIRDTPRSKVRSIAMGVVEIHGSVEGDQLIKSPLSRTDCVYYKWEIKEYRKSSSSGSKSSSYRWEGVGSGERSVPFFAKDETGRVLVKPDKAEFLVSSKKKVYFQKGKGLFSSLKGIGKILDAFKNYDPNNPDPLAPDGENLELLENGQSRLAISPGDRKYYEYYIEPGDKLFVLGTAAIDPEAPGKVVIRRGKNEKTFVISDTGEKAVLKKMMTLVRVSIIFGGLFLTAGIIMLLMNLGIIPRG